MYTVNKYINHKCNNGFTLTSLIKEFSPDCNHKSTKNDNDNYWYNL